MRINTYIVEHDLGFAPNPFHKICTLAACKPRIRKYSSVGDLVVGTSGVKSGEQGRLVYWMRIGNILTFDQYWEDPTFKRKRPYMRGSYMDCYGDNIYHRDSNSGEFLQEDSFHSEFEGSISVPNLERDTGTTDRVLIGTEYTYWGGSGPSIPVHLQDFIVKTQGHKCHFPEDRQTVFLRWLNTLEGKGYLAEPALWKSMERRRAKSGYANIMHSKK